MGLKAEDSVLSPWCLPGAFKKETPVQARGCFLTLRQKPWLGAAGRAQMSFEFCLYFSSRNSLEYRGGKVSASSLGAPKPCNSAWFLARVSSAR